jgi:hypothetical protein
MADCGGVVFPDESVEDFSISEHLNRCLAVTDKRKSAWQKRAIRCKWGSLKSVCRELPRVALAASVGPVYRLRVNRCVQAFQVRRERILT